MSNTLIAQERRYAPVASYALGLALGTADPAERVQAIHRAIAAVQALRTESG